MDKMYSDLASWRLLAEFAYLLREDGNAPRREFETHTFGLFARAEVMGDSYGRDLFAATR